MLPLDSFLIVAISPIFSHFGMESLILRQHATIHISCNLSIIKFGASRLQMTHSGTYGQESGIFQSVRQGFSMHVSGQMASVPLLEDMPLTIVLSLHTSQVAGMSDYQCG